MYNECIIVLGNYQQIAITKHEEGQGTGIMLLTARSEQYIDAMPAPVNACCYFVVSHSHSENTATSSDTDRDSAHPELPPPMKHFKFFSRKLTSPCSDEQEQAAGEPSFNSELQRYHAEIRDTTRLNVDNTLKFWMDRESVYPRLSRLG